MSATVGSDSGGGRSVEIMLGSDSGSPRRARRFVTDSLHRMGLERHVDTASLLVSELVTNALVHARGEIVTRVTSHPDGLRVEVRDTSEVAPVMHARNVDSETGRGMLVVSELADEWGADPGPEGKVVWFELRNHPLRPAPVSEAEHVLAGFLPRVVQQAPAGVLLVDLRAGDVTYANARACDMAGDVELPVGIDAWARAAELRTPGGEPLDDRDSPLARVARGLSVSGEPVTVSASWGGEQREVRVTGFALGPVPALRQHALVVLLETAPATVGAQDGDDALRALRDRAVVATDISFTISDPHQPDNPLVWVNPAFSRMTGYELAETAGRNCRFLQGSGTDPLAVAELRRAQAERRATTVTLLNYHKNGTAFWNEVSLSPVLDGAGGLTHFVGVQADVTARVQTEHEREAAHRAEREARAEAERARVEAEQARAAAEAAQRQLALLAEATTLLSATLAAGAEVERLTELAVPVLADWCAVDLVDPSGMPYRVAVSGEGLRTEATAAAGADPVARPPTSQVPTAVNKVLRDGRALLLADLGDDRSAVLTDADEHGDPRLRRSRSAMVLPLQARSQMLGAVTIVTTQASGRRLGAQALDLATDLVRRAALAVDNARLYMREHTVAEALQRSLLPALPQVEGLDVAARYLAASVGAEVGGDWYDLLVLPDGAVGVAIGDVMGHDLAAAAAMGQLRSVLRSYAWEGDPAALVLDRLDRLVQGLGMAQLATAIYARLEPATDEGRRLLHYANAGHLPPLLQRSDGTATYLSGGQSVLLGAPAQGERAQAVEPLTSGATLLLYTDGLVERRGADLDRGLGLLRSTVEAAGPAGGPEALCDRVLADLVGDRLADDVALLAIRIH